MEVDLSRKKSSLLTDLEREALDRARGVVERAGLLKMEQEEEIRMLNAVRSSCEGRNFKQKQTAAVLLNTARDRGSSS